MKVIRFLVILISIMYLSSCELSDLGTKNGRELTEATKEIILDSPEEMNTQQQLVSYLDGKIFESKKDLEFGLGENNVVYRKWKIIFQNEKFIWSYSDVSQSGGFEFIDPNTFNVMLSDTSFLVYLNTIEEEIIWDNNIYVFSNP